MNEVLDFLKSECKLPEVELGQKEEGIPFFIVYMENKRIAGIDLCLENETYYICMPKKKFIIYRMMVVGERPRIRKTLESLKRYILFLILND